MTSPRPLLRRDGWRPAGISISTRAGQVGGMKIVWKWRPTRGTTPTKG